MKHNHEVALAKAVASLRAADARGWDTFLAALAGRLDYITESMVSSPPESLQKFQGRALEARDLYRELVNAVKVAEQVYEQERKDAHARR